MFFFAGGRANCGVNKTFIGCVVDCPSEYCPVTESDANVACGPPAVCYGGCGCQYGYKIRSRTDRSCIVASDCRKFFILVS